MRLLIVLIAASLMAVTPAVALTEKERQLARQALSELQEAKAQFADAKAKLASADERAATAEQEAANARQFADQTQEKAAVLSKQIDVANSNELRLAQENAKMKPIYDRVTRWFGLGAIIFGLGMLLKNVFIAAAIVAVAFFIASFIFPAVGPLAMRLFKIVVSFLFIRKKSSNG